VKPPTNTAGTGLELTSLGQKNEDGKDYEHPMAITTNTGNLTNSLPLDFQNLRKHLNAKQ